MNDKCAAGTGRGMEVFSDLLGVPINNVGDRSFEFSGKEPPAADHPLVNHEKVVVTPHTAGITRQSFDALGRAVADNNERLKKGELLQYLANI